MTASYDKKIYEFITQPDNWQVAREVYEKMDYVKGQLVEEFWAEVRKEIENRIDLKEWKIKAKDKDENLVLGLTYPSWNNLFSIEFGNLQSEIWLGVWCDSGVKKVSELYTQIAGDLKALDKRLTNTDDNWWPAWFYIGDNFSQLSNLDKILPSNRKSYVDKYSAMLLDLKEKAKPIIDKAIINLK